jgi:hypothetical protein
MTQNTLHKLAGATKHVYDFRATEKEVAVAALTF